MVTIDNKVLATALKKHKEGLLPEVIFKRDVLAIAIRHIKNPKSSTSEDALKASLKPLGYNKTQLKTGLNWFLKSDTKNTKHKVSKYEDLSNFFEPLNRDFDITIAFEREVKRVVNYFTDSRIENILIAEPNELVDELINFKSFAKTVTTKKEKRTRKEIVNFLFSYSSFSNVTKNKYDAYDLCANLGVEACLYCNRNFIQTIVHGNDKIIRPELDHFIPQVSTSLLKISFYNLIPSCHFCNSNLKGEERFNLKDYFHPYYGSFDDHKTYFKYKPISPEAFFAPNDSSVEIKLDTREVIGNHKDRIEKNIETFKLNQIYNYNISLVNDLQRLKRLSNKKYLEWIRTKVFIDSKGKPKVSSIAEVYESVMMNYYKPEDYAKRPMAKFTKDISKELKIIK